MLHIVRELSENRILSVGSTGKASEYELFNEVVFSLSDAEGKVLIKPQTLRMTRDLVFDETELLGKISEAESIHRQMRRIGSVAVLRSRDLTTKYPIGTTAMPPPHCISRVNASRKSPLSTGNTS